MTNDIRSTSNSITDPKNHEETIKQFPTDNTLKLNVAKTELIKLSARNFSSEEIQLTGQSISAQSTAKCLGYWWHTNLTPVKSIEENISKARRAFFALSAYQGALKPLSGSSLFSTFVLPILLYGCENWVLSESLLSTLEKFQVETGRGILRLSKFHSDHCVFIALRWPRMRVYILLRKLTFLVKLLQPTSDSLSSCVFHTLASEDVCKISLVEQCQLLERDFGTSIFIQCLNEPENAITILQEAKEAVVSRDWEIMLEIAKCRQSTKHISHPQIASSWCKLWDLALDHGVCGTRKIQHLLRVM